MPTYLKRIAPCIYHICYDGLMSWSDIEDGQRRMHALITSYGEIDCKYIIIYDRHKMQMQPSLSFSTVKEMLRDTPSLRADDSIFINFSPVLRTVVNMLHRLVTGKGDIHFVDDLDDAIDLAYAILASQGMDNISHTPIP